MRKIINRLRTGILCLITFTLMLSVLTLALAGPVTSTAIDFHGATSTPAFGINPAGEVVAWYRTADLKTHDSEEFNLCPLANPVENLITKKERKLSCQYTQK
jgi:hypothetical protein